MEKSEERANYEELRKEWANGLARVMAKTSLGEVCYNCGSSEGIELHHIVPLRCGGTNNISNIAVLCHRCHMAVHHGQNIHQYGNKTNGGRPHKADDETMNKAFQLYLLGKIGASDCKRMLKISENCKIADMSVFKEYKKDRGIKKHRNNIDIIRKKRGYIKPGQTSGYIEYEDGTIENLTYEEYIVR